MPTRMVELHGDALRPMHLDAVDRRVDPASIRIAHDDDRTRAEERPAVAAVPDGRGKFTEIDVGLAVLQKGSVLYSDGRMGLERLALLHPGFERIERPHARIKPKRECRARRAGHGIGENANPAREPLDVVE